MRIETARFGTLEVNERELFLFPQGLIGMETLRQWALVADPVNPAVVWLQSASRSDRAIPMVSPRNFVEGFRVRVHRRALAPVQLRSGDRTYVLTTVAEDHGAMVTNLRAPIVLNLHRHLGCQVITEDALPMRYQISQRGSMRRAA